MSSCELPGALWVSKLHNYVLTFPHGLANKRECAKTIMQGSSVKPPPSYMYDQKIQVAAVSSVFAALCYFCCRISTKEPKIDISHHCMLACWIPLDSDFVCGAFVWALFVCGAFVVLVYTYVEAKRTLGVAVYRFSGEILILYSIR